MADPLYRQIAEDLRERIESGELPPGSQMPTELELRDRYNASRNTIRDALRWLTTRGLVDARAGQGTFVSRKIDPFVTLLSGPPWSEAEREIVYVSGEEADGRPLMFSVSKPRVEVQGATSGLAFALRLREGDEVVSRQQVRYIDGVAWSLRTSFCPRELVARGAERLLGASDIEMGVVAYLEQVLGLQQAGYEDRIQVGPPNRDEARLFKLADDGRVSMITVHRTCYTEAGSPFLVKITVFPADRNQLLALNGMVPGRNSMA